jgi:hypothetical protein
VRQAAVWRRPKLIARGDPDHDHVAAGIVAHLLELPSRAVVLAEDETHLNGLPHVRAQMTTGQWVYRLGRRRATDVITFLRMLAQAFPRAPKIVVIGDNDSIHHARAVLRP